MRIFATSALVCCAITVLFSSSARADFVLNCRLLDTAHPLWKQHCKADSLVRVRCRDRLECLALKKLIFSQSGSLDNRAGVVASPAPSVTSTLGSIVSGGAGSTFGGTVKGAGDTVGGAVDGLSARGSGAVSSTGSAVGGTVSGATNTIGDTATGAVDTVGSTLSR
jgi:hypothetical protein